MSLRRILLPVIALCLGGSAIAGVPLSGATFTDSSARAVLVTAANDWTPPTVAVTTAPGVVYGSVQVTADAADERGVVSSVALEVAAAGSPTFTRLCLDTVAPYACAWNTTVVTDGPYDLRAIATDDSGHTATSALVRVSVANSVSVVLDPFDPVVRGSVPLSARLQAAAGVTATMRIEYAVAGSGSWSTIPGCTDQTGVTIRSCTWATTGSAEYDVRAVAIVRGTAHYDVVLGITVDNVTPSATLTVPSGTLRGTIDLTATASDDLSGVASVAFEYRSSVSTNWLTCGVDTDAPYLCQLNTTSLPVGSYEFRAVATDAAGNTVTTATQTRTVDNSAGTVRITSPVAGQIVGGTVTVTADANFVGGITSVQIQARPTGGTFAALCTDTTAPYSCTWATGTSGPYELRAIMTQAVEGTVTSATVAVTVDNAPLKAHDVQVIASGTQGKVSAGDQVVLTYSGAVDLTTIKAGWAGESTSVTAVLKDAKLVGAAYANQDRLELGSALGQVASSVDLVALNKSTVVSGSMMTASRTTIAGASATVITVTLGTIDTPSVLASSTANATLRWTPTATVRSLAGAACSTTLAVESGTADKDY